MEDNFDDVSPKLKLPYTVYGQVWSDGLEIRNIFGMRLKRILYPVEFFNAKRQPKISSLTRLCCEQIIQNPDLLEKVSSYLPVNLYYTLLVTAEVKECNQSIAALMYSWPFKTFTLRDVISGYAENCKTREIYSLEPKFFKYERLFVKMLTNHSTSNLRVLDFRGLPTRDELTGILIRDISLLSHDESLPNDYHVIIDCEIKESVNALRLFLKLTRETKKIKIKLHINKLDIGYFSSSTNALDLLEEINPTELTGLSIRIEFLNETRLSILQRFTSLIAIELRKVNLPLPFLHKLRRLRLHSGKVSDVVIEPIAEKLEYLGLQRWFTSDTIVDDLRHLISVKMNLRELNLSGLRIVVNDWELWKNFLQSLASTLQILELEYCCRDKNLFLALVNCILRLVNLRYLNLGRTAINYDDMTHDVTKLIALPVLECIRLPGHNTFGSAENGNNVPTIRDRIALEFKNKSPPTIVVWHTNV